MHFHSTTKVVVVMTATLASAIFVPGSLPDGTYHGRQFQNGTTITISLSNSTFPPVIEEHEFVPRRSLAERGDALQGACWGYQLDPPSVDADNKALQAYVDGLKDHKLCSDSHNKWWGQVANEVLVYWCEDRNNECANPISSPYIQDGMAKMDSLCKPYEAGWAVTAVGDPDLKALMGKCNVNSNICNYV